MGKTGKRVAKKAAKKAVKKAYKQNPKAFIITAVAIVLVVAIAVAVLYFGFPEKWDMVIGLIVGDRTPSGNNGDNHPLQRGEGDLQVHFINVGQGDCILILFPDGKEMLIDCANYNNSSSIQESTLDYIGRYVTDGQIDYLMVTHGDSDHIYFVDEVLYAYDVDNIYMPFILAEPKNDAARAEAVANLPADKLALFTDDDTLTSGVYADFFIAALSEEGANIMFNMGNFSISSDTYRIDFYGYTAEDWENTGLSHAEAKNAVSPIGILEYNGRRVVLTGDSNEINEPKFIAQFSVDVLDCDVLKVGHHGSATSSTREFLDFVDCEYAIISCNASGNTFEHPRQATLDRFIADNMTIYRTDLHGTILLEIDGEGNMTFATDYNPPASDVLKGADAVA
ncbi:MAG: MBL fold metallo-hydrolase [Clostridia bacterium]|nr:MBL fold metallo-hydrolase [Clostridia bacterium]